ncbi:uncharacterized protein PRCAT00003141001 [Priceomyces carsonii]|uniref:uncharacterized protein n=1 Tax=Priceomyces carsonii TaxID=28549 RepID=UPI002ED8AFC6|nr:unnamed protein product [Priceomyces carsonii]
MSYEQLRLIMKGPESLDEVPQMLQLINSYKEQLDGQILEDIEQYKRNVDLNEDLQSLLQQYQTTRTRAEETKSKVNSITSAILHFDQCKRNLVQSMTIIKRLQMLIKANEELTVVLATHDYKKIYHFFTAVKDLLNFFKPYKSISEINQLSLSIGKTQNKLVDDIFIDFEEYSIKSQANEDLLYGCLILESIDNKYKDKLLNWFYNHQLKEIKSIFEGEAGSLENLDRRYVYFKNTLKEVQDVYLKEFPQEWSIDIELSKIFCNYTKQDLSGLLNSSMDSKLLLDSLTTTLDFEKYLNSKFDTSDFDRIILRVFEPFISIWIKEQDRSLDAKFLEFMSIPKIPQEFTSTNNLDELIILLKVNNVPNISNSSVELFRTFQKILARLLKLSNGEALIELSKVFTRSLYRYNDKILSPILPAQDANLTGIEPIKYLTMLINTGDYVVNNINDLEEVFKNVIDKEYKDKIVFDQVQEVYYRLISKSTDALLTKISNDLKFSWREFSNTNWTNMESTRETSVYMNDMIKSLTDNIKIILPLIIRDSFSKNFCNRLVELIVNLFLNNLNLAKPLSLLNIEQIESDIKVLKSKVVQFQLYSNPNYTTSKDEQTPSNLYIKFVNTQFSKLDIVLKLLTTPTLPVDNLVENYFLLIGDKSVKNFKKILRLKNIEKSQQQKYIESFKLQLTMDNDLVEESHILSVIQDELEKEEKLAILIPKNPLTPDTKSPKLLTSNIKLNNLRDFALSGENRLNENFRTFGKFFRKDHTSEKPL